ncbi:hypothetical protein [Ectopseudomonas guguanensis]|uniref:hypothetical protein n=1 Tax=Ectopseudomonas guguanensis TaxID=1198456 RepID=UPI00235222FE|nr:MULTISPECIES: hypothetical protein [Pseudomonas]
MHTHLAVSKIPAIFAGSILTIIGVRNILTSNICRFFRCFRNMRERFIAILEHKKLTAKKLEQLTGIDREKWYALRKGGRRINEDDIKAIVGLAPEYALWLVTGNTAPESGQTSPEYDEALSKLPSQSAGSN